MYMYNISQNFLKIKHKVKWVVKFAYALPSSVQLST